MKLLGRTAADIHLFVGGSSAKVLRNATNERWFARMPVAHSLR